MKLDPQLMKLYKATIRSLERRLGLKPTPSYALEKLLMNVERRATER